MSSANASAAGVVPLGTLTDAELAVLARPGARVGPRPVMPAWSRLDPDQRVVAVRDARACLSTRRLLGPETPARPDGPHDLRSVLALREAATAVVAVARVHPRGRDHWYAHVVRNVVLLERVSVDGVHFFALTSAPGLADLVVAAALHPDTPTAIFPASGSAEAETDWLRAEVALHSARTTRLLAWVSSPGGAWCATPGDVSAPCVPVVPATADRLLRGGVVDLVREEVARDR